MVTLAQLEVAIETALTAAGLTVSPGKYSVQDDYAAAPVVYIAIDKGEYDRATMTAFKREVTVALSVVFKAPDGTKAIRRGIYPILEGIEGLLTLQNLGLALEKPLAPVKFHNVTDDNLLAAGVMVFAHEFRTTVIVEKVETEEAVDLIRIGLSYYLKPGDDVEDAADVVEFEGTPYVPPEPDPPPEP